jgi:hypothetical protein
MVQNGWLECCFYANGDLRQNEADSAFGADDKYLVTTDFSLILSLMTATERAEDTTQYIISLGW